MNKKHFFPTRRWWVGTVVLLLAACGGGGGTGGSENPPPAPLSMAFPANAIVKLRTSGDRQVLLAERPSSLFATDAPTRKLAWTRASGVLAEYLPPAGWSLLDFAAHPSGHVSAIQATSTSLELVRLDPSGAVVQRQALADPQARFDPRIDEGGAFDPGSMVPVLSRDGARVAPIGEDVAVAVRTGMNAVVAYRFRWTPSGLERNWRTLVEPGMSLLGRFLTSGSHDVFGQLVSHVRVHLDTDEAGRTYVAAGGGALSNLFGAHAEHFQVEIPALYGAIVTQLSPTGQRVRSTVIDTAKVSELHGLRTTSGGVVAVGRVRTELRPDGTGWDGYAAIISSSGDLQHYAVVDVDRGDILLDIAPAANGGYWAAGATGYTQNPAGASISEEAAPLLVRLSATGSVVTRHSVAAGPRHNQLRAVSRWGGSWLVAGFANGPGTHSGDANPALITADGLLRELALAP